MNENSFEVNFEANKVYLFIVNYLKQALKISSEKWNKFISINENKLQLTLFLKNKEPNKLIFYLDKNGNIHFNHNSQQLQLYHNVKLCYFIKRDTFVLESKSQIVYGSLSKSHLKQYDYVLKEMNNYLYRNTETESVYSVKLFDDLNASLKCIKSTLNDYSRVTMSHDEILFSSLVEMIKAFKERDSTNRAQLIDLEETLAECFNQNRRILTDNQSQVLNIDTNKCLENEIKFFLEQKGVLQTLNEHLTNPSVLIDLPKILNSYQSVYANELDRSIHYFERELQQIEDKNLHLCTLKTYTDFINQANFQDLKDIFVPSFHNLALLWSFSEYYKIPKNFSILLQQFFNLLIQKTLDYINFPELVKHNIYDAQRKLDDVCNTSEILMNAYLEFNSKINRVFFNDNQVKEIELPKNLSIHRWKQLIQSLTIIKDIFETVIQYSLLERVEIVGFYSNTIEQEIKHIHEKITCYMQNLSNTVENQHFFNSEHFTQIKLEFDFLAMDSDTAIARIFNNTFQNSKDNLEMMFKLILMFDKLLDRKVIKNLIQHNYMKLIDVLNGEINSTQLLFDKKLQLGLSFVDSALFPHKVSLLTSTIVYIKSIRQRIEKFKDYLNKLAPKMIQSKQIAENIRQFETKYNNLLIIFDEYEKHVCNEFFRFLNGSIENIKYDSLLTFINDSKKIQLKFNQDVNDLIKQIPHFAKVDKQIAENAEQLVEDYDKLYGLYKIQLTYIINSYNRIIDTISELEYNIIAKEFSRINFELGRLMNEVKWSSNDALSYIQNIRISLEALDLRFGKAKQNEKEINDILSQFEKTIFDKSDAKFNILSIIDDKEERIVKRHKTLKEESKKIHFLIKENERLFESNNNNPFWDLYLQYLDTLVLEKLYNMMFMDLKCLLNELKNCKIDVHKSREHSRDSLIIQIKLHVQEASKSIEDKNIEDCLNDVIDNVYRQGEMVERVYKACGFDNYQFDLENMDILTEMRSEIQDHIKHIIDEYNEYKRQFQTYGRFFNSDDNEEFKSKSSKLNIKTLRNEIQLFHRTKKPNIQDREEKIKIKNLEIANYMAKVIEFDKKQIGLRITLNKKNLLQINHENPYHELDECYAEALKVELEYLKLNERASFLTDAGLQPPNSKHLQAFKRELNLLKSLWDLLKIVKDNISEWQNTFWNDINIESINTEARYITNELKALDKDVHSWELYVKTEKMLHETIASLKSISELQNPALRPRHLSDFINTCKISVVLNENTKLKDLLGLDFNGFHEAVKDIVDKAVREQFIEKFVEKLNKTWQNESFIAEDSLHDETIKLLVVQDEIVEALQSDQVQLQNLISTKNFFSEELSSWLSNLRTADQVINVLSSVQHTWSNLKSIFTKNEDLRLQFPKHTALFEEINQYFKDIAKENVKNLNLIECTNQPLLNEKLENLQTKLDECEKALGLYLEKKKMLFPRFFFLSSSDLLDILSHGSNIDRMQKYLPKIFESVAKLKYFENIGIIPIRSEYSSDENEDEYLNENNNAITDVMPLNTDNGRNVIGIWSIEGEYVDFNGKLFLHGKVELWLKSLSDKLQETVSFFLREALENYEETQKENWILHYPAQVAVTVNQIAWVSEVTTSMARLEQGYENAMREYQKKQLSQLNSLIALLTEDLSYSDRQKITSICIMDVHARDIIIQLVENKIENQYEFIWQSQLRHYWNSADKTCFVNICDAEFSYSNEYLGNQPRLVITPLTDRCYITLTQALRLYMGGSPEGPAGTGKTETTKDLGRALGLYVYVFNCSEQMDYKSCGDIYKGLCQIGAWGCFDEFNRISVDVLSVVAVQVKTIMNALKLKKPKFLFSNTKLKLVSTVGIFITMNPGYQGRTELPLNLKTLFRPCAMIIPDFDLISEILLVAQGFVEAKLLSKKLVTFYTMCRELLSKKKHYDWGMRAIKSVLVYAGSLKVSEDQSALSESQILIIALRDFNVPKIVAEDLPIFTNLISDIFPSIEIQRKANIYQESAIRNICLELKLQPDENFILKIRQLQELLDVRHCVFILGKAGTGKTQIWKTLSKLYSKDNDRFTVVDLDPKAVSNDELYGSINRVTREWKDGLLAKQIRELCNQQHDGPFWLLLDGDIDPRWIESLNSVMDDNKILTLANNERITLKASMRLLFEITDLNCATPATVSRAGIVYVSTSDIGWYSSVQSWLDRRDSTTEKTQLSILFDRYVPTCLAALKTRFKTIAPIIELAHVTTLCKLLDGLISRGILMEKESIELYFVWACIWSMGGTLCQDQQCDHRAEFSRWFCREFPKIKFPTNDSIFDCYVDDETKKFELWSKKLQQTSLDPEKPFYESLVQTVETLRIGFWVDLLIENSQPVLLIGSSGNGKSVIIEHSLSKLKMENWIVSRIPFNYFTNSSQLQLALEEKLERRAGSKYSPIGYKKLIFYIDDLNMPKVDEYQTIQSHTILRQHLDYGHWYDRQKLTLKEINDCQCIASMNPTTGNFTISSRLQRHFATFAIPCPNQDSLTRIYTTILNSHLTRTIEKKQFSEEIKLRMPNLIKVALKIHQSVSTSFLPTAKKFHYLFNLRDLTNIFQGIAFSIPEYCKDYNDLLRLYVHEAYRTYCDKLINEEDTHTFERIITEMIKKNVEDVSVDYIFKQPLMYFHYYNHSKNANYFSIDEMDKLKLSLSKSLELYNDLNEKMNLILFDDAIKHVCRISRILELPGANCALLVGTGGSGKQSLSRLAAFISSLEVAEIKNKSNYNLNDFSKDLSTIFVKAGMKKIGTVLLINESAIVDETFFVPINNYLGFGEIRNLFTQEEYENILNDIKRQGKSAYSKQTMPNDSIWSIFIDNIRNHFKCIICLTPSSNQIKTIIRKFPSIVFRSHIDWFHDWSPSALFAVARWYINNLDDNIKDKIAQFMCDAHKNINLIGDRYTKMEAFSYYATPKSFLNNLNAYKAFIEIKTIELDENINKFSKGIEKIETISEQIEVLQKVLKEQDIEIKKRSEEADLILDQLNIEKQKIDKEREISSKEQQRIQIIEQEIHKKQIECEKDLEKAEPVLIKAANALNTVQKDQIAEFKRFTKPSEGLNDVILSLLLLLNRGQINKLNKKPWDEFKDTHLAGDFLDKLRVFDKENISENTIRQLQPILNKTTFNRDFVAKKSLAMSGLCEWVINIVNFHRVYKYVKPKQKQLEETISSLKQAQYKLKQFDDTILRLEAETNIIKKKLNEANARKMMAQQEADQTLNVINLANRLINGLKSENNRWNNKVSTLSKQKESIAIDYLLPSVFLTYAGCFTKSYRSQLMNVIAPNVKSISNEENLELNPLSLIVDDTDIAKWNIEGLSSDSTSIENATIFTFAKRCPFLIDPQLQGIKWISSKYGEKIRIIQTYSKSFMKQVEAAIEDGNVLIISDIDEQIDSSISTLITLQNNAKPGSIIQFGSKDINWHPDFKLILQTRLSHPHYKPEIHAETTLINFCLTKDALEEQLLADIITKERPDLEKSSLELSKQKNTFKIIIKDLEIDLLMRLSKAKSNILEDITLIENLEKAKIAVSEIEKKHEEAMETLNQIDLARALYRPIAKRGVILYFSCQDMSTIHPLYKFSLKAFKNVFDKALSCVVPSLNIEQHLNNIIEIITDYLTNFTTMGLFEKHKMLFIYHLLFQILLEKNEVEANEVQFLYNYPYMKNCISPVDFLNDIQWGGIKALTQIKGMELFDKEIQESSKHWKKLIECQKPEKENSFKEWKNKTSMQKLCIIRALRKDRVNYALSQFLEEKMGKSFTICQKLDLNKIFHEYSMGNLPILFVISPGVDPFIEVENHGQKCGFSYAKHNLHYISMGQGQEQLATKLIKMAAKNGHWIVLQNIHLISNWLPSLDKLLNYYINDTNKAFRVFMSVEAEENFNNDTIPQNMIESAIKITCETPRGLKENIHKALDNFNEKTLEINTRDSEFKILLFSMSIFHAIIVERRRFGAIGWNKIYPFNDADLVSCINITRNYFENTKIHKIPCHDLKYLFGEIVYGGHISDQWDRRLCKSYLEEFINPKMFDNEWSIGNIILPQQITDYRDYHKYVDEHFASENLHLFGLHANAKLNYLSSLSDYLFQKLAHIQALDSFSIQIEASHQANKEDKIKYHLDEILTRLPDEYNLSELSSQSEEKTSFSVIAIQESRNMNKLINLIRNDLKELDLVLKGELAINNEIENLLNSIYYELVPQTWVNISYETTLSLGLWFQDLLARNKQLDAWVTNLQLPNSIWIGGLFNPQSFLTAVKQYSARKNQYPIDDLELFIEVTKKNHYELLQPSREGVYVHGVYIEGARWDVNHGHLIEAKLFELQSSMPVICIRALLNDKSDNTKQYECPVYATKLRNSLVGKFSLKSQEKPIKWILASVALLLQSS